MIVSPLRAFIGTPFTSMLTNSPLITIYAARGSCRNEPLFLDDAAPAVVDHVLELVAIVLDEALYGPRRGIAERADRMALDVICDVDEHRHVLAAALAGEDSLQHAVEPASALAAGRTLAAGLRHVEPRDALEHAHHAGGLVHHDDRRGAEGRARRAQRVVVHVDIDDLIAGHDGNRQSAGNHGLQLAALPHAARHREHVPERNAERQLEVAGLREVARDG